jgi:hypothetical protein
MVRSLVIWAGGPAIQDPEMPDHRAARRCENPHRLDAEID